MRKISIDSIKKKARKTADSDDQLNELIGKVKQKTNEVAKSDKLMKLFSILGLLVKMIKSYVSGEYRNYPKRTLLLILFGLIYFVTPLDALPDFIPMTGLLDDFTVLLWVCRSIQKDIEVFQEWENLNTETTN